MTKPMNLSPDQTEATRARATLAERCGQMHLALWSISRRGDVIEGPHAPGALGAWLNAPAVAHLISDAIEEAGPEPVEVVTLGEGFWVIVLRPLADDRRSGPVAALAMSEDALRSAAFEQACREADISIDVARTAVHAWATFDERAVRAVAPTLRTMLNDLTEIEESRGAIEGFTAQLTDSYETIHLLYNVSRSMHEFTHPDRFVRLSCDHLRSTTAFSWVGAYFGRFDCLPTTLREQIIVPDKAPLPEGYATAAATMLGEFVSRGGSRVQENIAGLSTREQPQVLAQPLLRDGKPVGLLLAGGKGGRDPDISSYDLQLFEAAAGYIVAFLQNASLYDEQRQLFMGTVRALTATIDAKDRYTRGHSERVAHLAQRLAVALGMPLETADRYRLAGVVHDVGKIGVPEAVICKQGRLTDEEFAYIKKHPEIGYHILKDLVPLRDVLPGVLHHHERYDGKGYPHGLAGEEIPMIARVLAVADTFDAMSSTRSYRPALPRERVLAEFEKCAGTQFDPQVAKAMLTIDLTEYDRLVAEHAEYLKPGTAAAA
ncbi:MAG: HD-GYP domain-containing protein [Planctomycetota bacterium]|nr:HD-GYP domain-containing protein [Planctomycetota bacterium]